MIGNTYIYLLMYCDVMVPVNREFVLEAAEIVMERISQVRHVLAPMPMR